MHVAARFVGSGIGKAMLDLLGGGGLGPVRKKIEECTRGCRLRTSSGWSLAFHVQFREWTGPRDRAVVVENIEAGGRIDDRRA